MVYAYALTSPTGVLNLHTPAAPSSRFSPTPTHPPRALLTLPGSPYTEFNQLKYVCKSLRAETAGMEVRFNDILITQATSSDAPVGAQLLAFWEKFCTQKKKWLHHTTFWLRDGRSMAVRLKRDRRGIGDPISELVRLSCGVGEVGASFEEAVGDGVVVLDGVLFAFVGEMGMKVVLPAVEKFAGLRYRWGDWGK